MSLLLEQLTFQKACDWCECKSVLRASCHEHNLKLTLLFRWYIARGVQFIQKLFYNVNRYPYDGIHKIMQVVVGSSTSVTR